jgi:tetratricopeptide (TPR) repeat protein
MAAPQSPEAPGRSVRVFVSSTFRDMGAERDELVKFVFPRLRRLCEERGVTFTDVDLRWGITEEERAEGKVIPLCFAEIHKCRPYLLAVLGERYGWVPDELPEVLGEPWLARETGRSVTELEILHGALRRPELAGQTYFYFRSPEYVDALPEHLQAVHREGPTPEDVMRFGATEATRRAEDRRTRLQSLKQAIRRSGLPLREGFRNPRELGEWVLADLTQNLERRFPFDSKPGPLETEATAHELFARRKGDAVVGREAQLALLDRHAAGSGPPVLVTGAPGSGKSALLGAWAIQYAEANPSAQTLTHFVGASAGSSDLSRMLARLLQEFARRFDIAEQPSATAIEQVVPWWLSLVNGRGRLVLVVDAIHQLSAQAGASPIAWIPDEVPPNIRLVVSADGATKEELLRRGWDELELDPFPANARRDLLATFRDRYGKDMPPGLREEIVAAPNTGSPLFLRSLLEELRVFGSAERLEATARQHLACGGPAQLFERILDRWEADYDRDRQGTVADTLRFLAVARRGLSEPEILDLLGDNAGALPRAGWESFYLAAEPFLGDREGLLSLGHGSFRDAVERRYLNDSDTRSAVHLRVARYFGARPVGSRRAEEQPWQERAAGAWDDLTATLTNVALFDRACADGRQDDWVSFWGSLARRVDPALACTRMVSEAELADLQAEALGRLKRRLSGLLRDLGRHEAAVKLMRSALRWAAPQEGHGDAATELLEADDLAELGRDCLAASLFGDAKDFVTEALGIRERILGPKSVIVAASLNDLGETYRRMGEPARAIPLHERALRSRELTLGPESPAVAESLNNIGCALAELSGFTEAEPLLRRALTTRRSCFGVDHPLVGDALNNLGHTLTRLGRPAEAIPLHESAVRVRERHFGVDHPSVAESLGNLGCALSASGRVREAAACHSRALRIVELVHGPDGPGVLTALNNIATIHFGQGRRLEAIESFRRAVRIAEANLGTAHPTTTFLRRQLALAEEC